MKRKFSFSVFYNYLLTYVGIAVFFCALIGIYLFNFFVSAYGATLLENEKQKAQAAVQDLEAQVEVMNRVTYSVSNEMGYSFDELQESNYTEFRMLNEFVRYANGGTLTNQYFLLYKDQQRVYAYNAESRGYTYTYSLFAEKVLGVDAQEAQSLYSQLNALQKNSILPLGTGYKLVFCFPMRIHKNTSNAVLCFVLTQDQLRQRANLVSGGLDAGEISYKGQPLFSFSQQEAEERGEQFSVQSANGDFVLSARADTSRYMSKLLSYRRITLFSLGVVLAILIVGIVAAHQHSKPIRRLKQQLHPEQKSGGAGRSANELSDIALRLQDILAENDQQKQEFSEKVHLLRSQAIHLLLRGEYNDSLKALTAQLNIQVENGHSGAVVLRFPERMPQDKLEGLMERIEDLSMDQARFYCAVEEKTGDLEVILHLSAMQEMGQEDALELIRELLAAEEIPARMGAGWVYADPHKLGASFAEAQDGLLEQGKEDFDEAISVNQRYFERIVGAVRLGETEEALHLFHLFEQENQDLLSSMMMQRYLLGDLLNQLVGIAREMRINIPHHQLSLVLTAPNCQTACDGLREIMEYIGAHTGVTESTDEKLINKVIDYVRNHYTENDLSLDRLASEFHVSAGYLSRLIRTSLGIKYKDYVLRLKMDYAKECLNQGMSVTMTSKNCGYANISHFIKAFKMYVGVTPSAYQKGEGLDCQPALVDEDEEE